MSKPVNLRVVGRIIRAAKILAQQYRKETGRPLGITGEVAEYEAARLLGLELMPARQAGYDAMRRRGSRVERIQIKARCILSDNPGQRLGRLDLTKPWDRAVLVLLDPDLEVTAIHEATRAKLAAAIRVPGSKARNERGALPVSKFKSVGRRVWPASKGVKS